MKRLNPYSGLVGGLSAGELELLSAAVEERRLREEIGVGTLAEAADRYRPRPACPACGEASPWRNGRNRMIVVGVTALSPRPITPPSSCRLAGP